MELDKKQIKAIFITGISILIIILLFLIIGIITVYRSNRTNDNINVSTGYSSIKEIITSYGCTYDNDTYNEKRDYPVEIKLVFKCNLYENDESNEEFFDNIIADIAKFVNYTSFKMIDTDNDITIEVVCQNGKIFQTIINDIEDYFIYMDSQLESSKYKEITTTTLVSNVSVLDYLIDNDWSTKADFGTRESIFKNYNIYFDEGIEYRKIGSEVYNVIFTSNYTEPVVNNIRVGASLSAVKQSLGTPSFEDEDLNVIGYKGKDIYVFFTNNEISIYKNKKYDYTGFWKLIDKFLEEDMEFKDFMNELTYLWMDYSEYTYSSESMFIAYPNRGIEVKLNYDNESGIIIYNNISEDLSTTKKYLKNTEFLSRLKVDSVFEAEKRRVQEIQDFKENCTTAETEATTKSMLFYSYLDKDENDDTLKVYFSSKNGEYPNRELNEDVDTYVWINDNYFVYSIYGKGIYCYDVISGNKTVITENGNNTYKIDSFKNNVLTYNGKELVLEY
jgi:hypothetical protein